MYYILHGEDELSQTEAVAKLRSKMGDPQFADLNTTQFDGRKISLGELQHACDAVPFLTDKRLVIVQGMLARLEPRRGKTDDAGKEIEEESNPTLAKDLIAYLDKLSETTRLIFIESKTLAKNNPILKHAASIDEKKAYVKEFTAPTEKMLPKWIQDRVKSKGGTIDGAAVAALAEHIGADLRLLDNEIEKLLVYRANETIRAQDVETLVASIRESDIFAMVDAVGARRRDLALKLMHEQLAQKAEPPALFGMIVRQFRLLLQMKDYATRGLTVDAAREQLKMHPFVANKTWTQALNFTVPQLEAIYQKLLDTDIAIKTGKTEPVLALDILMTELTK
ncbi:MAG: DNA polymerase III subunit delta [Chloroflexi bacterium]|nr:DNA polymerase III subunit delta [Chloroflexota bacterium]